MANPVPNPDKIRKYVTGIRNMCNLRFMHNRYICIGKRQEQMTSNPSYK